MDDERLKEIKRDIEVGRLLPGVSRYNLDTIAALVAEVERLRLESYERGWYATQRSDALHDIIWQCLTQEPSAALLAIQDLAQKALSENAPPRP